MKELNSQSMDEIERINKGISSNPARIRTRFVINAIHMLKF